MHISHRAMRIMAMAACASGAASAASAQNAEVTDVLQEVTVTATKTGAVGVQAAPFTIQAIGEDALTQGQMQGFDDYAKLVPGLASLNTKWVGRRALQRTMCVALAADKVLSVFVLTPDCEHVEGSP